MHGLDLVVGDGDLVAPSLRLAAVVPPNDQGPQALVVYARPHDEVVSTVDGDDVAREGPEDDQATLKETVITRERTSLDGFHETGIARQADELARARERRGSRALGHSDYVRLYRVFGLLPDEL
jgi:hypothetical protein